MFNDGLNVVRPICHRCGGVQVLMGSGWMCVDHRCVYHGIVIANGPTDWTDDYDGGEE